MSLKKSLIVERGVARAIAGGFSGTDVQERRIQLDGRNGERFVVNGSLESALFISLMKEIGLPRSLKSYMHYRGKLHQSGVLWSAEMLAETPLPMEQVKITKSMLLKELDYLARWQEEPIDGLNTITYSAFFRVMHKRGLSVLSGGWGLNHF